MADFQKSFQKEKRNINGYINETNFFESSKNNILSLRKNKINLMINKKRMKLLSPNLNEQINQIQPNGINISNLQHNINEPNGAESSNNEMIIQEGSINEDMDLEQYNLIKTEDNFQKLLENLDDIFNQNEPERIYQIINNIHDNLVKNIKNLELFKKHKVYA